MPGPSPFGQYWRDALRAHYTHVVRSGDARTEVTLRGLMLNKLGFTDGEMKTLYVEATMHVDQVGADFVPDAVFMRSLESEAETLIGSDVPEIAPEAIAAIAEQMDARLADQQADPATAEPVDASDDAPPPDTPAQLSLF